MKTLQQRIVALPHAPNRPYRHCALRALCGPHEDLNTSLPSRRHSLKKRDTLFRVGDRFHAIYMIQSGCIKTSMLTGGGDVQVLRFSLPGELVGLNAIGGTHYSCDATALEPTELCELPYVQLERLAHDVPQIQHRLLQLLSDEIVMDNKLLAMLGHQKADARLAHCLLNFSERYWQSGCTGSSIRLPMTRQELGDYLGLSLETISRLLSRFQASQLLRIQGRQLQLLDFPRLNAIAEHSLDAETTLA